MAGAGGAAGTAGAGTAGAGGAAGIAGAGGAAGIAGAGGTSGGAAGRGGAAGTGIAGGAAAAGSSGGAADRRAARAAQPVSRAQAAQPEAAAAPAVARWRRGGYRRRGAGGARNADAEPRASLRDRRLGPAPRGDLRRDESLYAVGTDAGIVRIMRAADDSEQAIIAAHEATLTAVAFSPDGSLIISGATTAASACFASPGSSSAR